MRSNEAQREARKKEKIEKELKQAKNDLETRTAELKTKAGNLQRAQEDITKLEQQLKEQRVSFCFQKWWCYTLYMHVSCSETEGQLVRVLDKVNQAKIDETYRCSR